LRGVPQQSVPDGLRIVSLLSGDGSLSAFQLCRDPFQSPSDLLITRIHTRSRHLGHVRDPTDVHRRD
ncbi:hypothetical protein, partial [Pseudonocardia sp. EV170527-09]|uniref:hypothetical protein n=1 Tax=Pseudonocardia sp. EV170527-09 TaxID=2603411 RepID=UPI0019609448